LTLFWFSGRDPRKSAAGCPCGAGEADEAVCAAVQCPATGTVFAAIGARVFRLGFQPLSDDNASDDDDDHDGRNNIHGGTNGDDGDGPGANGDDGDGPGANGDDGDGRGATGATTGAAAVLGTATWTHIGDLCDPDDPDADDEVGQLAVSRDGALLAACVDDGSIRVLKTADVGRGPQGGAGGRRGDDSKLRAGGGYRFWFFIHSDSQKKKKLTTTTTITNHNHNHPSDSRGGMPTGSATRPLPSAAPSGSRASRGGTSCGRRGSTATLSGGTRAARCGGSGPSTSSPTT
jgi:hypothetical protein